MENRQVAARGKWGELSVTIIQGLFWGDGIVIYPDCDGGYMNT